MLHCRQRVCNLGEERAAGACVCVCVCVCVAGTRRRKHSIIRYLHTRNCSNKFVHI